MIQLLPTLTAGSLPKPSWLSEPEKLWSPRKLEGEALVEGKRDALRVLLAEQQQAGIDIVSDGEQMCQLFVTTFIEHLVGVDSEKTLGSEWREYEQTFADLQKSTLDLISLERHNAHVPLERIELLRDKKVMMGMIEVANQAIESPEEAADTPRNALYIVDVGKLYACTNCGIAPLSRSVAIPQLQHDHARRPKSNTAIESFGLGLS